MMYLATRQGMPLVHQDKFLFRLVKNTRSSDRTDLSGTEKHKKVLMEKLDFWSLRKSNFSVF